MEKELEKSKSILAKEICTNVILTEKIDSLNEKISDLEGRNNILLNALQISEEKNNKLLMERSKLKDEVDKYTSKDKGLELTKSFFIPKSDDFRLETSSTMNKERKNMMLLSFADELDKKMSSVKKQNINFSQEI